MKHVQLECLKQLWTLICMKLFKMAQHPMNKYDVAEDTGNCAIVANSLVTVQNCETHLEKLLVSIFLFTPIAY